MLSFKRAKKMTVRRGTLGAKSATACYGTHRQPKNSDRQESPAVARKNALQSTQFLLQYSLLTFKVI